METLFVVICESNESNDQPVVDVLLGSDLFSEPLAVETDASFELESFSLLTEKPPFFALSAVGS